MTSNKLLILAAAASMAVACGGGERPTAVDQTGYPCYSGIYPHLAYYNSQGECGTGAVVPWAGALWVVTYSPHEPYGSDDKLYQIKPDLTQIVRPESIGGTPANRMIHTPSQQLFIGPYAIDTAANVRVIPYDRVPGRPTGNAAHLTDPDNRILLATMEAGFYDIDVHTLDAKTLYKDGNQMRREGATGRLSPLLPGYHGKGFYSSQGVAVYSNNGEEGELAQRQFDIPSGSLSEWDGKDWKVIRRNQFTEVTGPGGIEGNASTSDPIWSLGWDYKSVILACRDTVAGWTFYRLPKASFAYDGAHGWNTEWPRIRNVGTRENPDMLMTMHGMFWRFPHTFTSQNTAGITPRGAYLKVIGDFTEWNGRLVFGCDDSAQSEFLNKRRQKGNIGGTGQSNSNIWFGDMSTPDNVGPTTAAGSLWLKEQVEAGVPSDPFLFAGWDNRCAWMANRSDKDATITFEVDKKGDGTWTQLRTETLAAGESKFIPFEPQDEGVWIRATSDATIRADLTFVLAEAETRTTEPDAIFDGIAVVGGKADSEGLMYGLPDNRRALGLLATTADGKAYYELDAAMNLTPHDDPEMSQHIAEKFAIPHDVVEVDKGSVLIVDAKERRWRLPLGDEAYNDMIAEARLRLCREVATERDLFSCHGTFYELPAENADGFAKIRPVASHSFAINDYASYRGMMMLTGIDHSKAARNPHVVLSQDGKAAVWAGVIDDLWHMGKPTGHGGPWVESQVKAGEASDPYLIGFYDKRTMSLSHTDSGNVVFTVEVDPTGDGEWFRYGSFEVPAGQTFEHAFPQSFQGRWIRVTADRDTKATAWFEYR